MPLASVTAPVVRGTPAFTDDQIRALVAYVASFGPGPAIPNVVTSGADLAMGRDLFVTNCSACHGPSGGGGSVGGGFIAPSLAQSDATTVGEAVITGPDPMPRFSFAPADLNAVAAYVEYLRSAPQPGGIEPPQVGPVTEGFVAGLVLIVLLVVARFIGVRGGLRGSMPPVETPSPGADQAGGT
jgi:ubiquinol-cytochrome c reductase cytochrome c subunit